jgi:hypothetical protein
VDRIGSVGPVATTSSSSSSSSNWNYLTLGVTGLELGLGLGFGLGGWATKGQDTTGRRSKRRCEERMAAW